MVGVGGEAKDGVPQARDLVEDEVGEALVAVIESQATLARLTAGPPGVPEDRLAALRDAYLAALTDPELLAEAKKLNIPIVPLGGDDVAAAVNAALDRPPEVKRASGVIPPRVFKAMAEAYMKEIERNVKEGTAKQTPSR